MATLPDNYEQFELGKTLWQVPNHFGELANVGSGAYGQVR